MLLKLVWFGEKLGAALTTVFGRRGQKVGAHVGVESVLSGERLIAFLARVLMSLLLLGLMGRGRWVMGFLLLVRMLMVFLFLIVGRGWFHIVVGVSMAE